MGNTMKCSCGGNMLPSYKLRHKKEERLCNGCEYTRILVGFICESCNSVRNQNVFEKQESVAV